MEHTYEQKMQAQMMGIWAYANRSAEVLQSYVQRDAILIANQIGLDDELASHFVSGYIQAALKM